MTKVEDAYKLWYSIWNVDYIPLIAQRQKWHAETENLVENDIVYFKLKDSKLAQTWLIGKVEFVNISKDGKARTVGVSYKHDTEDGERKFSIVERPVRECIKLMNIEDTSLLDDIKAVQKVSKELLENDKIVPQHLLDRAFDDDSTTDDLQADETKELIEDEDTPPLDKKISKNERKKRKTELENLKIDNWEPPRNAKRTRNLSNLVNSNSTNPDDPPIIGLELMPYTEQESEVEDMGRLLNGEEGEVLNEQNPVILL